MAYKVFESAQDIKAKRRRRRFSYRMSVASVFEQANQNDASMQARFAKAFAGTNSNIRLGIEPK